MGFRQGTLENLAMKSLAHLSSHFWQGKRVLVTGHTGFKGSWLTLWLRRLGAKVTGISLPPHTTPNLYTLAGLESLCESHLEDIRNSVVLCSLLKQAQPECVFHLAAQPLVRASYHNPVETFSTNIMGTTHILESLRGLNSVRVAVMVTTDKVYRNNEWLWPYRENDALGGHDPYSASKAASEMVIASYRDAFFSAQGVAVASARAGNVIGGGDWSEDRLIPDAIRAWQSGQILEIRSPDAIRPWQHVLEPLAGYLILAEKLWHQPSLAGAYNFGPETNDAATVREVVEIARGVHGSGKAIYNDNIDKPYEAGVLTLDVAKSRNILGVKPRWSLSDAIRHTMEWYRGQHRGEEARTLCESQLAAYETLM